ncbi:MAG: hypothetical protein HOV97_24710 [Nonomuraea sp.]|nr:hypothetical protein [Nonomuraea sp.]
MTLERRLAARSRNQNNDWQAPRWAIAYKLPATEKITKLGRRGVEHRPHRHGVALQL